jgi:hypothetical protein
MEAVTAEFPNRETNANVSVTRGELYIVGRNFDLELDSYYLACSIFGMVGSNMTLQYTPIEQINGIHESLKRTFNLAVTRPLEYRRTQLYQLARMIQENADLFYDALDRDLRKPRLEAASQELGPIVKGAIYAAKHLDLWAKPDKPPVEKWKEEFEATVFKVPKGVALIIASVCLRWLSATSSELSITALGTIHLY